MQELSALLGNLNQKIILLNGLNNIGSNDCKGYINLSYFAHFLDFKDSSIFNRQIVHIDKIFNLLWFLE